MIPGISADDVTIRELSDTYEKTIAGDGEILYSWEVLNNLNTTVNVTLKQNDIDGDWDPVLSLDAFELQPKGSPGDGKIINLSVSTISDFDGEMVKSKVTFTTSSFSITKTATTTLDIPESDKSIVIWGFEMPLPDWLDNAFGHFFISSFLWIIAALLSLFVLKYVLPRLSRKTSTTLDDQILKVVGTPLFILVCIYGFIESLKFLELSSDVIIRIKSFYSFATYLISMYVCFKLLHIFLELLGEKWVKKKSYQIKGMLIPLFDKIGKAILSIVFLMLILDFFGIDISFLLAGAGLMGLVIAFAAQDTLANFFAGIFLIIEPKFNKNETIMMNDDVFVVKKIGLRTTQLYSITQHIDMIVPNQILASSNIVNLTQPDRYIRLKLKIPVSYDTNIDKLEEVMERIAQKHPDILTDEDGKKPLFCLDTYGASSLDFIYFFWIRNLENRFVIKHDVLKTIFNEFKVEDIEIPFDQRVLHLRDDPTSTVPRVTMEFDKGSKE